MQTQQRARPWMPNTAGQGKVRLLPLAGTYIITTNPLATPPNFRLYSHQTHHLAPLGGHGPRGRADNVAGHTSSRGPAHPP